MIAPESIKLSELPSVSLNSKDCLPEDAGVYIVFDRKHTVMYVGRSENIRSRWLNHHLCLDLERIGSVSVAWIKVDGNLERYVVEAILINWFKPSFNKSPGVINKPLAQLRIKAGLRAVDVGYELGINESTIRNWEKGRTIPTITFAQIDKLMELYNCSYEELRNAVKEAMALEEE